LARCAYPEGKAPKDLFSALTGMAKAALKPPSNLCDEGGLLKRYLVVKVAEGWSQVINWIAMPGLYTLEAAQQFVDNATANEPDSKFLIQEVGAA
jgi:hypothetical protein